ncbi:TPR-like protein [Annulohypoxylon maeteangense]|uniref:TPR-like protein n=1 Tax=Annulohypoxylon maeteangense TaxID=1927788 RepID=UPI00200787DA|nr:TPR-like protein [Annulohypoxylon maeteangense]KAI0887374.1 TPR-like protein [Annulohypoxylon maeteangense]
MSRSGKAAQYLARLEDARCDGKWDDVPELVRKIRKHATDRICLTTTAETEYAIIKASQKQRPGSRPATAVSLKDLDVAQLVPRLLGAIEAETSASEDKYQAQVCVGWLHWTVGDYTEASVRLPQNLENELGQGDQPSSVSEWTRVCSIKAAYLKANCLARNNERIAALAIFESALASLSYVWSGEKGRKQLRFWVELFLTEFCMLQSQALEKGEKTLEDPNSLAPFRSWAKYWEVSKAQGSALTGGYGFRGAVPRRRVWNEYYAAISGILQQDLPFPTGFVDVTNEASAYNQLRAELKKVEIAYEGLLLHETSFPRAEEQRQEIEDFVAAVMKNWSVLNSRFWHEQDLGPGGKEGLSRGILDILYRAATKTYHSTAILRYLFTVHLSVAEFDLAFHAFDSYLEIVKKGKARVDKTGHPEPSLDDDATVLEIISQAITALCKYGFGDAAEKAHSLGVELEGILQKLPAPLPNSQDNITTLDEEDGNGVILHPRISSRVYALSWQAIGISQAQWSRTTFDSPVRTESQSKAIRSFQKSLSPDNGNPTDVRTLFTLGLLLAEQRELAAAIDIVKAALMSNKKTAEQAESGSYWRERSLIPLWHLLALLLSARQDFIMAARACEGAFEQFDDPTVLFGSQNLQGTFRSEHLNEAEARDEKAQAKGLVDEMDDLEKEGMIEVKMTQLALLELLEGPEVAVNASHELLVLYARLFSGTQPPKAPATTQKAPMEVPKSSAGTIRTVRGGIFGSKSEKTPPRGLARVGTGESGRATIVPERPQTTQTAVSVSTTATTAPTIQVNGEAGDSRRSRRSSSVRSRRSDSGRRNSLRKREPSAQPKRTTSNASASHTPTNVDGEDFYTPAVDGTAQERADFFTWSSKGEVARQQSFSKGRGLLRFDSSASSTRGSGSAAEGLNTLSAPSSLPVVLFAKEQVKRQRQTVLVKVWLMIATFYRRAKMYSDAKGAIDEAVSLVDGLEGEVAKDTSGSVTLRDPGWGGKKSVEELWGDVQSELGYLALAENAHDIARDHFEEALMHYPDHPSAIVGLSNILLDVYNETLLPPAAIPSITLPDGQSTNMMPASSSPQRPRASSNKTGDIIALPSTPLGLGGNSLESDKPGTPLHETNDLSAEELPPPYKAVSLPLVDRLAARDRAYGLLSGLTKLGTGWNYSDAWFALARAHEDSGQPDKAKDVLWWCVELEEGMGAREWNCVSANGYVL